MLGKIQRNRTGNMVRLKGGTFSMGSEEFYPEEAPVRRVRVAPFWIDAVPVTNREFGDFVAATQYVSFAEVPPDPKNYPGMHPEMARAGSLVFSPPARAEALDDWTQWWQFRFGADWRHPSGADSSIEGREDHPVVHVAHCDAIAYARWARKTLPTEAQWEYAARGGHDGRAYQWGEELAPAGVMLANYWQGSFPNENTAQDGWELTSPVRSYPPNDFGLFDMIGNVWEWTRDWYTLPRAARKKGRDPCCSVSDPRGGSFDPKVPAVDTARRVTKGGSHLCAENYCQRYRPAARQGQAIDSPTSHVGFRCVVAG